MALEQRIQRALKLEREGDDGRRRVGVDWLFYFWFLVSLIHTLPRCDALVSLKSGKPKILYKSTALYLGRLFTTREDIRIFRTQLRDKSPELWLNDRHHDAMRKPGSKLLRGLDSHVQRA